MERRYQETQKKNDRYRIISQESYINDDKKRQIARIPPDRNTTYIDKQYKHSVYSTKDSKNNNTKDIYKNTIQLLLKELNNSGHTKQIQSKEQKRILLDQCRNKETDGYNRLKLQLLIDGQLVPQWLNSDDSIQCNVLSTRNKNTIIKQLDEINTSVESIYKVIEKNKILQINEQRKLICDLLTLFFRSCITTEISGILRPLCEHCIKYWQEILQKDKMNGQSYIPSILNVQRYVWSQNERTNSDILFEFIGKRLHVNISSIHQQRPITSTVLKREEAQITEDLQSYRSSLRNVANKVCVQQQENQQEKQEQQEQQQGIVKNIITSSHESLVQWQLQNLPFQYNTQNRDEVLNEQINLQIYGKTIDEKYSSIISKLTAPIPVHIFWML